MSCEEKNGKNWKLYLVAVGVAVLLGAVVQHFLVVLDSGFQSLLRGLVFLVVNPPDSMDINDAFPGFGVGEDPFSRQISEVQRLFPGIHT